MRITNFIENEVARNRFLLISEHYNSFPNISSKFSLNEVGNPDFEFEGNGAVMKHISRVNLSFVFPFPFAIAFSLQFPFLFSLPFAFAFAFAFQFQFSFGGCSALLVPKLFINI